MKRRKFILSNILLLAGLGTKLRAFPLKLSRNAAVDPFDIDFIGENSSYLSYKKIIELNPGVKLNKLQNTTVFSNNSKAVFINTSNNIAKIAIKALEQGKNVFVNTPSCSFEDYSQMQLHANLNDLRIGVNNPLRFLEAVIIAKKFLFSNELGKIEDLEIRISPEACLEEQGYIGMGSNIVNLITRLIGDTPHTIKATGVVENKNTTYTGLKFTALLKKAKINYKTEKRTGKSDWQLNFIGEKASLEIHSDNTCIHKIPNGKEIIVFKGVKEDIDNASGLLLKDFIRSCRTGKEPEINSCEILQSILLNDGAVKSASNAKTVKLIESSYPDSNDHYLMNI